MVHSHAPEVNMNVSTLLRPALCLVRMALCLAMLSGCIASDPQAQEPPVASASAPDHVAAEAAQPRVAAPEIAMPTTPVQQEVAPDVAEGPGIFHIVRLSSTCPQWYNELTTFEALPGSVATIDGELIVQISNWPALMGTFVNATPKLAGSLTFTTEESDAEVLCELAADVKITDGVFAAEIVEHMTSVGSLNCTMVETLRFEPGLYL